MSTSTLSLSTLAFLVTRFFERCPALLYSGFALFGVALFFHQTALFLLPFGLFLLFILGIMPGRRIPALLILLLFWGTTALQVEFPRASIFDKGELTFRVVDTLPSKSRNKQRLRVEVVNFRSETKGTTEGKTIAKGIHGIVNVRSHHKFAPYAVYQAKASFYSKGESFGFFTLLTTPEMQAMPPLLDDLHERCQRYFLLRSASLLAPSPERGILESMVLGVKIDRLTRGMLNKLGLDHVVVVSGFHLAMVATALFFLLSLFVSMTIVRSLTILFLTGYLIVVGFQPSLLRAASASLLFLLAPFFWRKSNGCNSLGVALLLFLLFDPLAISSIGFQLSFLATLGILLWFFPLQEWLELNGQQKSLSQMLLKPATITFSALSLITPILLMQFGAVSLFGLFTNIFIPPLMSMAMGIYLIALLPPLFPILGVDQLLATSAQWLMRYIYWFFENLDSLQGWQLKIGCTPFIGCTALVILVVAGIIASESLSTRSQLSV